MNELNPGINVKAMLSEQGLKEGEVYRLLATERHPNLIGNKVVYTLEKDGKHLLVLHVEGLLAEVI